MKGLPCDPSFLPQIVLIGMQAAEAGSGKDAKLICSLFSAMFTDKGAEFPASTLYAGLDRFCSSNDTDSGKALVTLLIEKEVLKDIDDHRESLSEATLAHFSAEDADAAEVPVEDAIAALAASDMRGKELAEAAAKKGIDAVNISAGVALLSAILASDEAVRDVETSWAEEEAFGILLKQVLYVEDPEKDVAAESASALFAIQRAFHRLKFP